MTSGIPEDEPGDDKSHVEPRWLEADLKRAIAVAEEAGLESYRIEVAPDGTISIVVSAQN